MRRAQRAANVRKMKRAIRNVEVQVDELILRGPFASSHYAIGDAFSHELGLLFGEMNLGSQLATEMQIPVMRAAQIAIPPNAKPALIGGQIARAVYGGLNTMNKGGHP
jgi:hypothetical protein